MPHLSDYRKIIVKCECGISRQYDAKLMLERVGDMVLPDLRVMIAEKLGCERENSTSVYGRCQMVFDIEAMEKANGDG